LEFKDYPINSLIFNLDKSFLFFSNTKLYLFIDEENIEPQLIFKQLEKKEYINEPLPLKNKSYLNVIYQNLNHSKSIYLVMYKVIPNLRNDPHKFFNNSYYKAGIENKYKFICAKNKNDLIQKKQKLEEELLEKRERTNGMNLTNSFDMIEENAQHYENNNNFLCYDVSLKCKRIVKLDKQAFYECVVEQLLIYELTHYENQINFYNKGLDDITKEIICLTHFLNYKESMKQINLLKARLYKTLSESIKHKNFSHTKELQK